MCISISQKAHPHPANAHLISKIFESESVAPDLSHRRIVVYIPSRTSGGNCMLDVALFAVSVLAMAPSFPISLYR